MLEPSIHPHSDMPRPPLPTWSRAWVFDKKETFCTHSFSGLWFRVLTSYNATFLWISQPHSLKPVTPSQTHSLTWSESATKHIGASEIYCYVTMAMLGCRMRCTLRYFTASCLYLLLGSHVWYRTETASPGGRCIIDFTKSSTTKPQENKRPVRCQPTQPRGPISSKVVVCFYCVKHPVYKHLIYCVYTSCYLLAWLFLYMDTLQIYAQTSTDKSKRKVQ